MLVKILYTHMSLQKYLSLFCPTQKNYGIYELIKALWKCKHREVLIAMFQSSGFHSISLSPRSTQQLAVVTHGLSWFPGWRHSSHVTLVNSLYKREMLLSMKKDSGLYLTQFFIAVSECKMTFQRLFQYRDCMEICQ